ncbi:MAG TPA: UDP-2,4-diacetamido-2,4,6-trideoxy-beta-L-altropyranose hydrolase, partial [Alphaproteobacteria bacterium]|nr:UDP-2,4-diacetamido-2,4,6-trideoxy-beta-L-altropyranose hydrolase [Alphaproteobacteria bacterium]
WEKVAKPDNTRLMAIDDIADRAHICDLLMDQNLGRKPKDYTQRIPAECRMLIGPRYALVRPEFGEARKKIENMPLAKRPNNWLACVGGHDTHHILGKIVSAWEVLPTPKLTLVVGSGSPNLEDLKKRVASIKDVTLHVQSDNMAQLMADANLFIGTTGGISWERCCLGLPAIMGMIADNQAPNLAALDAHGTGINIGKWQDIQVPALTKIFKTALADPKTLENMAAKSAELVDGQGAERVAVAITNFGV